MGKLGLNGRVINGAEPEGRTRLMILDFNGTYMPRDDAERDKSLEHKAVHLMRRRVGFDIAIVSGSRMDKLKVLANKTGVMAFAEAGALEYRMNSLGGREVGSLVGQQEMELLSKASGVIEKMIETEQYKDLFFKVREATLALDKPTDVPFEEFAAGVRRHLDINLGEAASGLALTESTNSLDITLVGHDKKAIVALLVSRLGINVSEVVCIGNGQNDIPGFEYVFSGGGTVVLTRNSVPEVVAHMASATGSGGVILSNYESTAAVIDLLKGIHRKTLDE